MKTLLTRLFTILLIVSAWSCTKEKVPPVATSASSDEEQLLPSEVVTANVAPGLYRIVKFIDTGDDETSQFNGYRFRFRANGELIATTNAGKAFRGSWDLNSAQTMMNISISGNDALEDLDDDDWRVITLTNMRIRLRSPGPDIVVFQKIQ